MLGSVLAKTVRSEMRGERDVWKTERTKGREKRKRGERERERERERAC
jgi:hypothetical protein